MGTIIILTFGLFFACTVQAQVGSSVSSDGTAPNNNAMLDVQSPSTGDGKGILIPRVTLAQRTTANAALAGGLLDGSGNLRGGAAQGLIVYQTDGNQGLYFNTSQSAMPTWVYLGTSTTNYLPLTGGTMSGALNMGAQIVSNVMHIDFSGATVSIGNQANGSTIGTAVGRMANAYNYGAALGWSAKGSERGAAVGYNAKGVYFGSALGDASNGTNAGAAVGYAALGFDYGAAIGYLANGSVSGAVVGCQANGCSYGAAMGYDANGCSDGAAVGVSADGSDSGAAIGRSSRGTDHGAAVGRLVWGNNYGAAMGYFADGYTYGVAIGAYANGINTNVAIGYQANAGDGTERIAIGHNVDNDFDNTAVIRGTLYLDGGTGVNWRAIFGSGDWANKAFEIDHPLDPGNKILRHFCLEGPQVWNVYAGNVQLVNGVALVQLPDYYSALNLVGSEICSLTPWGRANVWVAQGVNNNTFSIAGDTDVKVSWTIKVLRNDPGCREDLKRRPVEQMKSELQ